MQPSLSTRRGRLLVRCLVLVSIVAASAAIFASPVAATAPAKYSFSFSFTDVLTDICSFPITLDSTVNVTEIDYFDQSGTTLIRWDWHGEQHDTYTANGKTLVGLPYHYHLQTLLDSNGNMTYQFGDGEFEKIRLPDGSLFIAAGRADFVARGALFILSPDKGNPGNVVGFCAALAP
jgi:hypothetical protein